MSTEHQGAYDESINIEMSHTTGLEYDFNSPDALLQRPIRTVKKLYRPTIAGISLALKPWWQTILVTSSVIAVLVDPLFFYIPYTSEERKCMGRDKQVQTTALIFRSVTDITLLVHIVYQLHMAIKLAAGSSVSEDEISVYQYGLKLFLDQMIQFAKEFSRKLSDRSFLTNVLSILPLPQLLMVGLFFDIGGKNYLLANEILSSFLLMQYVPRIYRIYLSCGAITDSATLWVKGVFNFFLYILASHVLGSFWYFFSVQREISCWYQTCIDTKRSESECTFYCHGNITAALITPELNQTLNDQCILKVPASMADPPFDFGMFSDVFKNDIQEKINIPQKIGYCVWWGLRNLSAFGTSLETSSYLWETIFAMFISITGLLLFSCLIGNNIQSYMEMKQTRAEKVREKLGKKKNDIENWMETHGLKEDMREEVRKNIVAKLEEDLNADLDDIYSMLPWYTKKVLKRFVGMRTLRNVPMFRLVNASVLKTICDYLQPVKYLENTTVFHQGEPFDRMVFIIDGSMWTYKTATESGSHSGQATGGALATSSSTEAHFLKKGDAYGHMLLQLVSSSSTELPISLFNVKCNTKVEAFVLMARDLKNIVIEFGDFWLTSLDFNAAASEDQVAVPEGQFQQQQILKRRVASSTINPTDYNG